MLKYAAITLIGISLVGCDNDASVVSRNLSQAGGQFEINRRIILYNGITGEYILTIEGLCSQQPSNDSPKKMAVICKTDANTYKKHFLGLSDNVTYFVEQLEPIKASKYRYHVIFKPTTIIPDTTIP